VDVESRRHPRVNQVAKRTELRRSVPLMKLGHDHFALRSTCGRWPSRCARRQSRSTTRRWQKLAWFTEPKLAEGERRMVDQTGIEPVTS
jgi:hypothetical protein